MKENWYNENLNQMNEYLVYRPIECLRLRNLWDKMKRNKRAWKIIQYNVI